MEPEGAVHQSRDNIVFAAAREVAKEPQPENLLRVPIFREGAGAQAGVHEVSNRRLIEGGIKREGQAVGAARNLTRGHMANSWMRDEGLRLAADEVVHQAQVDGFFPNRASRQRTSKQQGSHNLWSAGFDGLEGNQCTHAYADDDDLIRVAETPSRDVE